MAEFNFFVPATMLGGGAGSGPVYGLITQASSGWIQVDTGWATDDWFGYGFTYSGTTVTGGVLTAYYASSFGEIDVGVSGLSVSAAAVAAQVGAGSTAGVGQILASGNDVMTGYSTGADVMLGWAGNDRLSGGQGHDHLWGGTGADIIDGGAGFDYARYDYATEGVYARLDTRQGYTGEAAGDQFVSVESLVGSGFNDVLVGDAGSNNIIGGNGVDYLWGLGGYDAIAGYAGNDFLWGGTSGDELYGHEGNDSFYWAKGDGSDYIDGGTDFDALFFTDRASSDLTYIGMQNGVITAHFGTEHLTFTHIEAIQFTDMTQFI
ncbi:calcium-binding protein [Bosea sp. BIWAKO-01]|uniref:calcium-binding protein n=1 Tax=Bosea sp. BIWAKO-01 TaxID=506668 RepID=UPI0008537010|nr:calcium-binding protein [Bosea sp. BIWAKO-01]GAU80688.1 calcium binding hemolysin protein [Bosea sp. BIWAKO-01]